MSEKKVFLNKEKVQDLITQYVLTPNKDIRNQIVIECINLVQYKTVKMAKRINFMLPPEDLEAYGYIALIKAIEKYNPQKGNFLTYANIRIEGNIINAVRKFSMYPRCIFYDILRYNKAIDNFVKENYREPTELELMSILKISRKKMLYIQSIRSMVLSKPFESSEKNEKNYVDANSPEALYLNGENKQCLRQMINELSDKDKLIITEIYYHQKTNAEIAKEYGIDRNIIDTWHYRAIQRLRKKINKAEICVKKE